MRLFSFQFFFWKGGPFFQSLVYYFCGKGFGASNTGKTQLCLSAVAMCASSGGKVAHFSFFLLVGFTPSYYPSKNIKINYVYANFRLSLWTLLETFASKDF